MNQGPGQPGIGQHPARRGPDAKLVIGLVAGGVVVLVGLVLLLRSAAHTHEADCAAAVGRARATTSERGIEAARPDIASAKRVCKSLRADEIAALETKPATTATATSTPTDAPPAAPTPGAMVVLGNDDDGPPTVLVSRSVTSWKDEDAVVRAPRGTKARVLSVRELEGVGGRNIVRYEVEILATKKRGWIHAWGIRPD